MPRKRTGEIKESVENLRQLEARFQGRPEVARIRMLYILSENPDYAIENVAATVGFSKQSVKRWLKIYREGGLDALLEMESRKRKDDVDEGVGLLRGKIVGGEFNNLESIAEWIDAYRMSNQRKIQEEKYGRKAKPPVAVGVSHRERDSNAQPGPLKMPDNVLRFLSSLKFTPDVNEWTISLREALRGFLGDVDLVSLAVNLQCQLLNPGGPSESKIAVTQSILNGTQTVRTLLENVGNEEQDHVNRVLENMRRRKFSFGKYHQPYSFVYYYGGDTYLGAILLWREREKTPISEDTLGIMRGMHHFFIFLLSDIVARHQAAKPVDHAFATAIEELTTKTGLTMQERRILYLQLLGLGYEEIAGTLNISLNTVRTHIRSIYIKTGAHGQTELFAKYFTPRIDPK